MLYGKVEEIKSSKLSFHSQIYLTLFVKVTRVVPKILLNKILNFKSYKRLVLFYAKKKISTELRIGSIQLKNSMQGPTTFALFIA